MKSIKVEFKWALVFTIMSMLWMALEKATGLHDVKKNITSTQISMPYRLS